jgi:hypothetical protein
MQQYMISKHIPMSGSSDERRSGSMGIRVLVYLP